MSTSARPRTSPVEWHKENRSLLSTARGGQTTSRSTRECSLNTTRLATARLDLVQSTVRLELNKRHDSVQQLKEELVSVAHDVFVETNHLDAQKERVSQALLVKDLPLEINQACQEWRSQRDEVELVADAVDSELEKEEKLLKDIQLSLKTAIEDCVGQLRLLRAAKFQLDQDISDKSTAEQIDATCADLRATQSDTSRRANPVVETIPTAADPEGWEAFSRENIATALREKQSSEELRAALVEDILQFEKVLLQQTNITDDAFNARIADVTDIRNAAQASLVETEQELAAQGANIADLEKAISDQAGPLALAEDRLVKRSQRPNVELVRDSAHRELVAEVAEIKRVVADLQQQKADAEEAHRELVRAQKRLQVDIRVKSNSINLDNQCMQRRQQYKYRPQ